jgi:hypothetical protein
VVERDEERVLGRPPAADRLARAVARSKIEATLFGEVEHVTVGRYRLLEQIGAGGMGVVWGAWDPELERRVAIKLLKPELAPRRERIVAEGQALAKLSHPNVVAVHDVGVVDDQVYLVMEWVRGKNMRAYCMEPRSVRDVVAIYRAAGEGLAAAHRAGLIHRDFKPDNAIVGDDGRVRVLDFGLADRGTADELRGAGTPRYMAPEQARGGAITHAVDQYAFCVSLEESLRARGDAEVPPWLATIIERGTAEAANARFASMDDLLHALARDPRTVWRRRVLVGAALAVAGLAFAAGTLRNKSGAVEHCVGAPGELEQTWNPQVGSSLAAHLRSLGPYGAEEATRVDGELTRFRDAWVASHRAACLKRDRGELTVPLYERNLGCLARARVSMHTIVEVLGRASAAKLPDALVAVRSLPSPERCLTETETETIAPPPPALAPVVAALDNDIARARVLGLAQHQDAIGAGNDVAARAEATGYLPVIARARLTQGLTMTLQDDGTSAFGPLGRAVEAALSVGDDVTAIEAFARQVYAWAYADHAKLPGAQDPAAGVALAEPIARRLGEDGGFARALLYNFLGVSRLAASDRPGAKRWFEQARAAAATSESYELAWIWSNLALVEPDPVKRAALSEHAVGELRARLGPHHPTTLEVQRNAAFLIENTRDALAKFRAPCELMARLHRHLTIENAACNFYLGVMAEDLGDTAQARAAFAAVDAAHSQGDAAIAAAFVLLFDGQFAAAERTIAPWIDELASAPEFYLKQRAVTALTVVARAREGMKREGDATGAWRRAYAILGELEFLDTAPLYQRQLARTRRELARLLARSRPTEAATLAEQASSWYDRVGGYDSTVEALRAITRRDAR